MMSVALIAPSGHHGLGHGCFGLFGDEYHNDISNTDNPLHTMQESAGIIMMFW